MVACWAHNPLVVGSIPIPATTKKIFKKRFDELKSSFYLCETIG